jgi:hypothetical protein
MEPYLVVKYLDEEFITGVSENNYLYQNWSEEFSLKVDKT